jgi:hypothetical protein
MSRPSMKRAQRKRPKKPLIDTPFPVERRLTPAELEAYGKDATRRITHDEAVCLLLAIRPPSTEAERQTDMYKAASEWLRANVPHTAR